MEDNNKIFRRKVFVITGGTGSFGNVMARHLLTLDVAAVSDSETSAHPTGPRRSHPSPHLLQPP